MSPRDPKRLRLVAGSALQRRVLAATAEEEPSPELRDRMAGALGVSAAAIGAASGAAVAKATVSATKAAAGISTTSALPWITVGVLGLAVAGAIFSAREWKASVRPSPAPAPRMIASAPDFPAAAIEPASPAPVPRPDLPDVPSGGRARMVAAPVDLRGQTSLVDAARDAVSSGAADRALAILRQYEDRYPAGVFRPEAAVLKIEALAELGRGAEARTLAERFVAEYGEGSLTDRVRHVAGLAHP